jgi:hypothetical protein
MDHLCALAPEKVQFLLKYQVHICPFKGLSEIMSVLCMKMKQGDTGHFKHGVPIYFKVIILVNKNKIY